MASGVPLHWTTRARPLAPVAVAASGALATALAEHVLDRDVVSLEALRGVAGISWIVLLGPEDALPWMDGVVLLGVEPSAPTLLVPTTLEASLPPSLVARALGGADRAPPLAVLPRDRTVVSVAAARRLDRGVLASWVRARVEPPKARG